MTKIESLNELKNLLDATTSKNGTKYIDAERREVRLDGVESHPIVVYERGCGHCHYTFDEIYTDLRTVW